MPNKDSIPAISNENKKKQKFDDEILQFIDSDRIEVPGI